MSVQLQNGTICKYSQSREQRQITFDYAETKAFICAKHKYSQSREQRQITFDYAETKAFICAKHKYNERLSEAV